jgi:thiol-disulfide isomerase/thioredoxin
MSISSIVLLSAALLGGFNDVPEPICRPAVPATNATAPFGQRVEFTFSELETKQAISSASLRGKPVLIAFWWSKCQICRRGMRVLQELEQQFQKDGLVILTAAVDQQEDLVRQVLDPFRKTSWKNTIDRDGAIARFCAANAVSNVPRWWLLDSQGVLRCSNAFGDANAKVKSMLQERGDSK